MRSLNIQYSISWFVSVSIVWSQISREELRLTLTNQNIFEIGRFYVM